MDHRPKIDNMSPEFILGLIKCDRDVGPDRVLVAHRRNDATPIGHCAAHMYV